MSDAALKMDRMYRVQRHIYDLTRSRYLLGRDLAIGAMAPPADGSILEIGCGTARNLIVAGRMFPQAQLYGCDVSREMLETAGAAIDRAGIRARTRLCVADATRFDPQRAFGRAQFDRVLISYALSMIPQWRQVVEAAVDLAGPGGSVHIVDFGDQRDLPGWFAQTLLAWLDLFDVEPRLDMERALGVVASGSGAALRFERLYRGYAFHAVISR